LPIKWIHTHRLLLGLLLASVVLRLAVFAYITPTPEKYYTYDSSGYDRRAINLLDHHILSGNATAPFTPDLERTPVYPGFLAAIFGVFGHRPAIAILIQILLGSLTAVVTYAVARELRFSNVAAALAGFIVAVDPVSVMTANRLLTETLFTLTLVTGMLLLLRFWRNGQLQWLIGSAVLLALAALTRPVSQFLPIALLPLFAFAARRARLRSLALAGALFLVLSLGLTYAWAVRNYHETGVFTLSSISDTNLIYYRARAVLASAEGVSQEAAWNALQARIDTQAAEQHLSPREKVALERKEAIKILVQHPLLTARMTATGAGRLLFDPGYTITCTLLDQHSTSYECFPGKSTMNEPGLIGKATGKLDQMTGVQQATLGFSVCLMIAIYAGAALGVVSLLRTRNWVALLLPVVIVAYFTLLSSGAEANSRLRIPIVPFLALLAGVGLQLLVVRITDYARRRTASRRRPEASQAMPVGIKTSQTMRLQSAARSATGLTRRWLDRG
jgi:4-amino-4-deoxy-L-arabinose transferase-like glycosyltransferase